MKLSLNDYPGEIASTVFTAGCNFHCPYCHNSSLINYNDQNLDEEFFKYIKQRNHLIKAVCITGGEPTLQKDLLDFCQRCKNNNLLVKLDTNGTQPQVLEELIEKSLINYVAMDIKAPLDQYQPLFSNDDYQKEIKKSLTLLRKSLLAYELRLTVHPKLIDCSKTIEIAKSLTDSELIILQGYKYSEGVLNPSFCGEKPCSNSFLEQLKDCMMKYHKKVIIRN